MEERIAAAVDRIDAAPQVVPAADCMYRLIADDFLQHRRRRGPVNPAQHQKAAVKPRAEQVKEIAVEHGKPAVVAHGRNEIGAHRHKRGGAARGPVEAPEKLLPARLGRVVDFRRGGFAAGHGKAGDRALDPRAVGAEILGQRPEERAPVILAEAVVTAENFARQRYPRGLAASAYERATHVGERGRPIDRVARPWAKLEDGASPFRNRGEEI